jgi:DNA polymerase-3 subunit delta
VLRSLADGPPQPVYLLFGGDSYLVERALDGVLERLNTRRGGAGIVRLRPGDDRFVARAEEALRTPPLFGGPPVVVVHDVDALATDEQEGLLAALPTPGHGHLICVGGTPDLRRRLFATCVREQWAFELRPLPFARLPSWLRGEAARRGHDLAVEAAQMLADLVGADLRACIGELEKLSLYAGPGRPIAPNDVAAVVGATRARSAFDLAELVQRRDVGAALALLRRLLQQGERPIALAALLASQIRRLLVAKDLLAGGAPPPEVVRRLGLPPWVGERLVEAARRYALAELEAAASAAAALDVGLKSSRLSPLAQLEGFLLRLRAGEGERRGVTRPSGRAPGG